MGIDTGIAWCDSTFNAWRGCVEVSPACSFCYAKTLAKRNPAVLGTWGNKDSGGTRVVAAASYWSQPVKWNKAAAELPKYIVKPGSQPIEYVPVNRPRVFCNSLADVFEDWDGPMLNHKGEQLFGPLGNPITLDDIRTRLFQLIDATPNLDWLILTKRPENILRMWPTVAGNALSPKKNCRYNVWLGATAENQKFASERASHLAACRELAPVLFLSCEPLLGSIDLNAIDTASQTPLRWVRPATGVIDWVIAGAESGSNRRQTELSWVESLAKQCSESGIAFFNKQMEINGRITDDISEFPNHLQIREFPLLSI